jgi:hypothetical protein
MSLNFKWTDIENFNELFEPVPSDYQPRMYDYVVYGVDKKPEKRFNSKTITLIFMSIVVGHNRITATNVKDWFIRLELWQDISGPCLTDSTGKGVRLTFADIQRHIGLSTNASIESWATFCKKLRSIVERRMKKVGEKAA